MNRPRWSDWWKRLWGRRTALDWRLALEELAERWVPDATGPFRTALPLALNGAPAAGVLGPGPTDYRFTVTAAGRLVAEAAPTGEAARLTLFAADGTVLLQSTGQSPDNPVGRIDVHLTGTAAGTTYYLEVQGLGGGTGAYALRADYAPASAPFDPIQLQGTLWGHSYDVNGDGAPDLVAANFDSNSVFVMVGRGDGTFAPAVTYTVGTGPNDVIVTDFNGDGTPDLVSANFDGTVSVLLGRGGGTFADAVSVQLGGAPSALAAGDFNGDGRADLAVADFDGGVVRVLPGRGDGTFDPAANYGVGAGPYELVAGDFNGDARPDLAVANYNDNTVSMLLGRSDGTFRSTTPVAVGSEPYGMATADLNGDRKLDLVTANFTTNDVSILLGGGDGTFTVTSAPTGVSPYTVAVGDFNSDGHPDLAVSNLYDGTLSVLDGRGDGTFAPQVVSYVGSSPAMLVAADFNRDGHVDLAHGDYAGHLSIDLGRGDGSFQFPSHAGSNGLNVAAGDFNGDGHADLVGVDYTTSSIQVLLGRSDGTFWPGGRFSTGSDSDAVTVADLNHDGTLDLVVSNYSTSNVSVLLGRGDGTFGSPTLFATGRIPGQAAVADFNGDGIPDIATPNFGSDTVSVLLGLGGGTFSSPFDIAVGAGPAALAVGDFNGDGRPDVVCANTGSGTLSALLNRGNGTFSDGGALATPGAPQSVAVGDFDGDRVPDVASANANGTVSVFRGQVGGGFLPLTDLAPGFGPTTTAGFMPAQLLAADVNRDGRSDLIVASGTDNRLKVYYGQADGTFQGSGPITTGGPVLTVAAADVNGDGRLDVVTTTGGSSDIAVLFNSDGTLGSTTRVPVPAGPVAVAQGDLNDDGYPDLVTANYASNTVSVRLGRGDGTFGDPVPYAVGAGPDAVTLVDGNRDGRLDVLVSNSSDGTVSTLLGIGDGTFQAPITFSVGGAPGALAAADLNGDGLVDLVVADPASGTVSVELNNGHALPVGQRYAVGEGPTAVAVADLNGDGLVDLVVADALSQDVTVLLGRGDGTFRSLPAVHIGARPVALAVADLNRDGIPDVVTADQAAGAVTALLGLGDGTFRTPVAVPVGGAPVSVVAGDFNGDGRVDLAVSDLAGNAVAILQGRGDGTFQSLAPVPVGSAPVATVVADFNADGRLDVATANGQGDPISVALGLGTGEFVAPTVSPPTVPAPLVADFNRDGIPDVVSLRKDGGILFRAGRAGAASAFAPPTLLNPDPAEAARSLSVVATRDGPVLVADGARTNTVSLYAWAEAGFLSTTAGNLGAFVPTDVAAGDVNGDGMDELIVGSAATGDVFIALQRAGGPSATTAWDYHLNLGAGFTDLTLTDLNGDGLPDLVCTYQAAGTVGVALNDRTNPFSSALRFRAGTGLLAVTGSGGGPQLESRDAPLAVAAGPFSGGSSQDLAVLDGAAREITILRGDGRGGVFNPVPSETLATGPDPVALVTGDFNGDGRPDLAVLNRGRADLSVFLQQPQGGFTEVLSPGPDGGLVRPCAGIDPTGVSVADVNHDGLPDLLVGNAEGDVLTLHGNGDGTFGSYQSLDPRVVLAVLGRKAEGGYQVAVASRSGDRITLQSDNGTQPFTQGRANGILGPTAVAVADLNGDGVTDLVVANGAGNTIIVYPGIGEGGYGTGQRFAVGTDPVGIAVGDLNGDGVPDLAIANNGSNDISVLLGHGGGAAWTLTPGPRLRAGAGPTDVVAQDVTGDGLADVLVANGEGNSVYLLKAVGGGFFADQRPAVFHTGEGPVQLFVGRFDNESGLDLVTVNAGSSDVSFFPGFGAGHEIVTAGATPVAAVAGDFNGSGRLDLLVASQDGHFTLLRGGLGDLQVTNVFTSNVANLSDIALAGVYGSSVQVYVTQDGRADAVSMTFALAVQGGGDFSDDVSPGTAGPGVPSGGGGAGGDLTVTIEHTAGGDDQAAGGARTGLRPYQVTEFVSPAGGPLELLTALVLESAPEGEDGRAAAGAPLVLPIMWMDAEVETVSVDPSGDPAADPNDPDAVGRNGVIAGAVGAPLREYLASQEAAGEVPFQSPLSWFDGSVQAPARPDAAVTAPAPADTPGRAFPVAEPPTEAGLTVDETDASQGASRLWQVAARALAISVVSAFVVLGPSGRRRPRPALPPTRVRDFWRASL